MNRTDPNSFHSGVIEMDEPMNSHRELFNKLVASQSQPTIMIANNMATEPEYLQTLDYETTRCSSAIEPNTHQWAKRPNEIADEQQQSHQSQRRCSSLSGPSSTSSSNGTTTEKHHSLNYRNVCDLLPDDFKKEPVVFSSFRNRWYTNEEVASILTNFNSHAEWQTNELQVRPKSGAVFLYSREKVRYRQDGYCWKKRKNGRTTREDHMKLKVQGVECIYGCYVHSAILPTFHRRCYWLLQNPDIVLVHYLNQPADDQSKMMITFNSSSLEAYTRRSWTNEEIIEEIGSVFGGISQIKHMLNINVPPEVTTNLFQQQQQQQQPQQHQQQQPQEQLYQQPAVALQQTSLIVDHCENQQPIQTQELLVLPCEGEQHLPYSNDTASANNNETCCNNSIAELKAEDSTQQHTTPPSSTDLLALSDPFGQATPVQQPFQDESISDNQRYHQLNASYPAHQIHMNLKLEEPLQQQTDGSVPVNEQRQHSFSSNEAEDDLLMNDFNIQNSSLGQVDEELVSNVIESLSNVEDLRDLLSGITGSNDQPHQQQQQPIGSRDNSAGMLSPLDNDSIHDERSVDLLSSTTNTTTTTGVSSFDLYNNYSYRQDQASNDNSPYFNDHHQQHYHLQQLQQFDARSSLSDETDSLLIRPSPSAPVSRSNSTGNNVNYSSCNMSHISWSSYDSGTS